jgi:hypothetical protein
MSGDTAGQGLVREVSSILVRCPGQNKIIEPLPFFHGYRQGRLKN